MLYSNSSKELSNKFTNLVNIKDYINQIKRIFLDKSLKKHDINKNDYYIKYHSYPG